MLFLMILCGAFEESCGNGKNHKKKQNVPIYAIVSRRKRTSREGSMPSISALQKPGEKAPEAGAYYCFVCSLRDEAFSCEMQAGQLFLACPHCLERKVAEWDLAWKPEKNRPVRRRRSAPRQWPGALAKTV